jgi:signal transduction histidine kinase
MRSRAAEIGARMTISSTPGEGTLVHTETATDDG